MGRQIRTQQALSKNLALEDVLCSRRTVRILKVLKKLGRLNVSEIAERLGTNYRATSIRLETLENSGILRHIELGRVRLYSFKESPRARAVAGFLEVWEAEKQEKEESLRTSYGSADS